MSKKAVLFRKSLKKRETKAVPSSKADYLAPRTVRWRILALSPPWSSPKKSQCLIKPTKGVRL